jgi:hypothetical protein
VSISVHTSDGSTLLGEKVVPVSSLAMLVEQHAVVPLRGAIGMRRDEP